MSSANIGKKVTWGSPPKTGEIVAFVPAFTPASAYAKNIAGCVPQGTGRVSFDRYIVKVSPTAVGDHKRGGLRQPDWYLPRAVHIDAALRD